MCGVPIERADDYLQRLIAAGHRVAVCEQTEDPAEAKKRGPNRWCAATWCASSRPARSPRTACSSPAAPTCSSPWRERRASETEWRYGLAAVDISTGRFQVGETDGAGLAAEIARLDPREIVLPDTIHDDPALETLWREAQGGGLPVAAGRARPGSASARLSDFFGVATLDAFGAVHARRGRARRGGALLLCRDARNWAPARRYRLRPAKRRARRSPSMRRRAPTSNSPARSPASGRAACWRPSIAP